MREERNDVLKGHWHQRPALKQELFWNLELQSLDSQLIGAKCFLINLLKFHEELGWYLSVGIMYFMVIPYFWQFLHSSKTQRS